MKKKPYAKIEYTNLSPDYTYTICELSDINDHIECFKHDTEDLDHTGFDEWKDKGYLPEIKLTVVMMSDPEYLEWFTKYVEPTA